MECAKVGRVSEDVSKEFRFEINDFQVEMPHSSRRVTDFGGKRPTEFFGASIAVLTRFGASVTWVPAK
jgi:hypothetical protein